MLAPSAFGCENDMVHVRVEIHVCILLSMELFAQKSERAGRDEQVVKGFPIF